MKRNNDWRIVDPTLRSVIYWRSFSTPSKYDLDNLRPGDHVKLIFALNARVKERMWVVITSIGSESGCLGRVVNDPVHQHTKLEFGTVVSFWPKHIVDIDNKRQHEPSDSFIHRDALGGEVAGSTLVRCGVKDKIYRENYKYELLNANKVSRNRYKVCCVPAYIYDVCLNDVVEVNGRNMVVRVVEKSLNHDYRVYSKFTASLRMLAWVMTMLSAKIERFSDHFIGVSVKGRNEALRTYCLLSGLSWLGIDFETVESAGVTDPRSKK